MITRQEINALAQDFEQSIPLLEPMKIFDCAICGWTRDSAENVHILYDIDAIIKSLQDNDGMSEEDAVEYFEYNTRRAIAYMGENAPILMQKEVPEVYKDMALDDANPPKDEELF